MSSGDATRMSTASIRLVDQHREHALEDRAPDAVVRRRRRGDGAVAIVVVAAAGLLAEKAGLDEPALRERRLVARIVEERLEHRARDRVVHVVADEVHQLERAHAESAELFHRPVDRRRRRRCLPRAAGSTRRRTAARCG